MAEQKEYVVAWTYDDCHHCAFSGKLHFKDVDQKGVLEQF